MKINTEKSRFRILLLTIMLFFLIFSIHIKGVPGYLLPRIIVLGLIFLFSFFKILKKPNKKIKIKKNDLLWISFTIFQLFYTYSIILINNVKKNASTDLSQTFNFLILVVITPLLLKFVFINVKEFCDCMICATFFQSVTVICSALIPKVRIFLENIQAFSMERYNYRIIGLGIAGAGGSVYLVCGFLLNIYILTFYKKKILYINTLILNFIAIALVGRTGFYVALILLIYLFLFNSKKIVSSFKFNFKLFIICLFLILFFGFMIRNNSKINIELLSYTYDRLFEIFTNNRTLKTLAKGTKLVPGISLNTLFGTGINRGLTESGLFFNSDSGYIKRYASIGLIVGMISYLVFFVYYWSLLIKIKEKKKVSFIWICYILLSIIEYKEPFIFMLSYPFTILMLANLLIEDQNKKFFKRKVKSFIIKGENN